MLFILADHSINTNIAAYCEDSQYGWNCNVSTQNSLRKLRTFLACHPHFLDGADYPSVISGTPMRKRASKQLEANPACMCSRYPTVIRR